ncbi:MAG: cyclic-di-AMP receptor [Chloroflexi bacterium]|nr:cyclic-di-AMP receptor [Chloroflexota bacterium]
MKIDRLIFVVIQAQDVKRATRALAQAGLMATELASSGGFLGLRSTTLLVGIESSQVEEAVEIIHVNCRQRVEYVSTPLEGAPLAIPIATPITVGGATVFTMTVERFEEF